MKDSYRKLIKKRFLALGITLALILIFMVWDIMTGSSSLSIGGTLRILIEGPSASSKYHSIVWQIRMPLTIACIVVGASLALAGEQMQTILHNPLASPYTLGISSAASFGASLSIVTGFPFTPLHWINVSVAALVFSLGACCMIYFVCKKLNTDTKGMILLGMVVTFLFNALQSLMQYIADRDQLSEIMHWMFGSLSKSSWSGNLFCGIVFLLFFLLTMKTSWKLTAFSAGEERASSLGIDISKLRLSVFFYSSCLTAAAVSYVGSIGFIGLVAPHIARSYVSDDQRFLIPLTALFGALLLLSANILSKILRPGELMPVGIITNIIGVLFLFYLIIRRRV